MEDNTQDQEQDGILEFTTREEYILCSCNALGAIESLDAYTAADKARLNRIKRKCLRILDEMVKEMHEELFEDEDE
jgi:hypothetical protein